MMVFNSYCGVCFVFSLRPVYGGEQNKTHNTIAVGDHHTQDEDKQNKAPQ
jgi:hypothetical protein